ncbi:MAG TPA: hypothetical protein VFH51_03940 [Myxococcota bacterium]|nr:hypothetical protein [Myxococcota bacterium]
MRRRPSLRALLLPSLAFAACEPMAKPPPSGPPGYFMSVFVIPEGSQTADDTVDYGIDLGIPAATGALTRRRERSALPEESPAMRARIAWDKARRDSIDRIIAAGARRRLLARPHLAATCAPACDSNTMCWQGHCTAAPTLRAIDNSGDVPCTLVTVLPAANAAPINVLLETAKDSTAARSAAVDAAQKFAQTFPDELALVGRAGHTGAVDRDGDGRMTVVFADLAAAGAAQGTLLVGLFNPADMMDLGAVGGNNNVADLLWVAVPDGTTITSTMAAGTMAHEYVHLSSYASRVLGMTPPQAEALWLDEGLAHLVEDATGWGPSTVRVVEAALDKWSLAPLTSPDDTSPLRGTAYLFLRHLLDKKAREAGATDAASSEARTAAAALIGGLLNDPKLGYDHAVFRTLTPDDVSHWLLGVYATGNAAVTHDDAHLYDYLPPAASSVTQNLMGMAPRSSTFRDGTGAVVDLRGPETDELDNTSPDISDNLNDSGHATFHAMGFDARQATLANTTVQPVTGPFLRVVQVEGTPQ